MYFTKSQYFHQPKRKKEKIFGAKFTFINNTFTQNISISNINVTLSMVEGFTFIFTMIMSLYVNEQNFIYVFFKCT